ncbi:hypothetical protein EYF80_029721 [Liparis tanakae]|uniref:Uncharacterized protein n=1 Tax=Liparis tanakae TaxID=230148 RepID=A0A4Z2H551_9TELE|nr:hypothetical protein EYF80_029721 [Liparis tanakae]
MVRLSTTSELIIPSRHLVISSEAMTRYQPAEQERSSPPPNSNVVTLPPEHVETDDDEQPELRVVP